MPGERAQRVVQVQGSDGQCGHVQRLANVTSGIRSTLVMVEERAAGGEKEQNRAAQEGRGAAHKGSP